MADKKRQNYNEIISFYRFKLYFLDYKNDIIMYKNI